MEIWFTPPDSDRTSFQRLGKSPSSNFGAANEPTVPGVRGRAAAPSRANSSSAACWRFAHSQLLARAPLPWLSPRTHRPAPPAHLSPRCADEAQPSLPPPSPRAGEAETATHRAPRRAVGLLWLSWLLVARFRRDDPWPGPTQRHGTALPSPTCARAPGRNTLAAACHPRLRPPAPSDRTSPRPSPPPAHLAGSRGSARGA